MPRENSLLDMQDYGLWNGVVVGPNLGQVLIVISCMNNEVIAVDTSLSGVMTL